MPPPPPDYLPAELDCLARAGLAAGADVTWRALELPAGAGYFAVGDAAAVVDPASSHGVLRALLSGMLAGQLTAGVLGRELDPAIAAREYSKWMTASFERDVTVLRELYRRLPHPPAWLAAPAGRGFARRGRDPAVAGGLGSVGAGGL